MNAQQAIEAHRRWKETLRVAMATRDPLDESTIASDGCCAFGQWINTEGQSNFADAAQLPVCCEAHRQFHLEAAKIAKLVNAGLFVEADRQLISTTSDYSQASQRLVKAVIALFETPSAA